MGTAIRLVSAFSVLQKGVVVSMDKHKAGLTLFIRLSRNVARSGWRIRFPRTIIPPEP
jgi:hypothetical protein